VTGDLGPEGYTELPPRRSDLPLKWIAECEKSHPKCKSRMPNDFIPTRVIDVGANPTDTPCLRIKDECLEVLAGRKYVTLSHCWGRDPSKITQLLTGNLQAMEKAIDIASLPKTFQDAIRVTRDLRIRYLWIDSLCIIQDDVKDWFKESSTMGDIYSNSYCTISATGAMDGSEGLFLDREQLVLGSFLCVKADWTGQGPRKYYEREGTLSKLPQGKKDTELWSREVDSATLNSRGWVLQERFLSQRNLMFGRNCLFWECAGKRASETFPDDLPHWITSSHFKISSETALASMAPRGAMYRPENEKKANDLMAVRAWLLAMTGAQIPVTFQEKGNFSSEYLAFPIRIYMLTRKDIEGDGAPGAPNAYRYWNTIVAYYSKKLLTNESDRLIALYGIAQSIQKQYTKGEYVAGLWKEHLLNQLMWTTYKNLKKRRPAAYRAPSWSWASVVGKLMFRDILEAEAHDKVARVEEVKVYTVEGKEGQVTGGYLKIHGKVLTGTWRSMDGKDKPMSDRKEDDETALWDDTRTTKPTTTFVMEEIPSSVFGYPDVEEDAFQGGETVCLALQKREKVDESGKHGSWSLVVEGLVLMRIGSETFRRIGFFNAYGEGARAIDQAPKTTVEIV
jgi:hypothetical protein